MEEALQDCHGRLPDAVMDILMAAVRSFVGGAPQADDITVQVVTYSGPRP
jgi:serine phosphatase RsbU (regulator of sigma subunit)